MDIKWLYTVLLLMASAIGLHAQEKVDSTVIKPTLNPILETPARTQIVLPILMAPSLDEQESKEEMAARINRETYLRVMTSVHQSLSLNRPPLISGTPFLTGPYQFRPGTVPVMSATNPFIYAVTPGMTPYAHRYSPDVFPQCIRTELDFSSGTYRQVMVQWKELEKSMSRSFGGPYRLEPVPRIRYNNSLDSIIP